MKKIKRNTNHSKSTLKLSIIILCLLTLTIYILFSLYFKTKLEKSEIRLFNDLRSESLEFEIRLNDSVIIKNPQNKNFNSLYTFPSENGRYTLETKINSKIEKKEFLIVDNKPKYIYIHFKDRHSTYILYHFKLRDSLIRKEINTEKISRDEFNTLSKRVWQSINFEDIKSIGYNPNGVYFDIKIFDQPYSLN